MPSPTQRRGGRAEDRAVFFLRRHGYRILERHLTSRFGEIDIVAEKNGVPYIVEVKYRARDTNWPIELSMSQRKMERLLLTWDTYQQQRGVQSAVPVRCIWLLVTPNLIRELIL